jgi:hypothetical protein
MSFCKAVLSLVAILLTSASLALAQGTYTQFDYPGALTTAGLGIDTGGDIVGFYEDASGYAHGFLLKENSYTTLDYPGAIYTYLFGINDPGQIVGNATLPPGHERRFRL